MAEKAHGTCVVTLKTFIAFKLVGLSRNCVQYEGAPATGILVFVTGFSLQLLQGLAPLADARTRVMVLGSFPSQASLAKQQYYGHPRNHFWFLMSCVLNEPLVQWPYALRSERLLARGVGVWDVLAVCERAGSLDSAITRAQANDPRDLLASAPGITRACFNGSFAHAHMHAWAASGVDVCGLPSSSPANATHRFDVKLAAWRKALAPLL